MKLLTILPLIGVLLGWCLNELSQYFKVRRDQKSSLCRVINALIEFRAYIVHRRDYFTTVLETGKLSREGQDLLIDFVSSERFLSNKISDKITKACELIQTIDPLLCHNVETMCDSMLSLCRINHERITSRDIDMRDVELEARTLKTLTICLDAHIKALAKKYSFYFYFRYLKYMKKDHTGAERMKEIFEYV